MANDRVGWGKSLRMKVEIPVRQVIACGRIIMANGKKL